MTLLSVKLILSFLVSLGVALLSTGCNNKRQSPSQSIPATNIAAAHSGKVLIHFKEFEFGKDWSSDFEIINDTTGPMFYVGSADNDRFTYCTLAARRQDNKSEMPAVTVRDFCVLGNLVTIQTLQPGQTAVLAARKGEVQDLLHLTQGSSVAAQIGFEVFVGDDRHRETVWSEQITFPDGNPR